MGVSTHNIPHWFLICDGCDEIKVIKKKDLKAYNGAQAARSLGWSFGKDGKTYCTTCRKYNHHDKYKYDK